MEGIEKLRLYFEHKGLDDFRDELDDIADEIEREIAERYMKVPVDADGVPIRIGDELCLSKLTRGEVSALRLTPDGWEWELEGDDWYDIRFTYHVKPDPVKELLEKLVRDVRGSYYLTAEQNRWVDECAERIREAVEK